LTPIQVRREIHLPPLECPKSDDIVGLWHGVTRDAMWGKEDWVKKRTHKSPNVDSRKQEGRLRFWDRVKGEIAWASLC
jgi:hypothetical protein